MDRFGVAKLPDEFITTRCVSEGSCRVGGWGRNEQSSPQAAWLALGHGMTELHRRDIPWLEPHFPACRHDKSATSAESTRHRPAAGWIPHNPLRQQGIMPWRPMRTHWTVLAASGLMSSRSWN